MMSIVAVLLAVEIVADKIPALDSVNDVVQTFVRPTSGESCSDPGYRGADRRVTDPGEFARTGQWVPVAVGAVTAWWST